MEDQPDHSHVAEAGAELERDGGDQPENICVGRAVQHTAQIGHGERDAKTEKGEPSRPQEPGPEAARVVLRRRDRRLFL